MDLTEQMAELRQTIQAAFHVAYNLKSTADTDDLVALLASALDIIGDEPSGDPFPPDPPEVSGDEPDGSPESIDLVSDFPF